MSNPTVTVPIREALRYAQGRAERLARTQQLEIGEDLFVRIAPGGRKFLLFCLDGEPDRSSAEAVAAALALRNPTYGWHQGATLRSLTVIEEGAADVPEAAGADDGDS
ncbi:hypothetical protein [Deinococcus soli (ex Cha et al. 2016)]|uniref:Uncharacterized protein n=2 Tax=Deinococcus soli (ex Cha et al. 2016) TaxID=1309411 RepID=A0ACC6KL75_9DEIO|nr:hypothetical protein [Deinococcus soli (ex Cha et al. 2016)]MDR6220589.1 hypothetical protein [Deinococcus soli (ex Cha et al. 2016)]MDR6330325.1 hypothetical protein [Deinococcus soli (ex Cha et al. 2016)]MDR6753167.1 hypothetical protein [Deinococcus soli (ex Cha et al. 2016)]GGB58407.1 hypothetical protein GCM10008019_12900 [Deinococcus soli (ex Cha et al. 2016)]